MLGDLDTTAPPATNGLVAVRMIPNASLTELAGVGHLDFLSTCTQLGLAKVPICKTRLPQEGTHAWAIKVVEVFFDRQLGVTRRLRFRRPALMNEVSHPDHVAYPQSSERAACPRPS
jgi:hypothetical protein